MLTVRAERVSDEPFVSWMKREWLLVVITTGVALDWLPWVLTPFLPQIAPLLSGTRLLVLPGLLLACLLRPSWIARPHVLGVAYLASILIGGGLGYLAGTVAPSRLTTIVVNGFVLIYYLQIRSLLSIRRVLAIVFVSSLLVPLVQSLTWLGVISVAMLESLGLILEHSGTRIFSIFDTTTVGFIPLIIPACLGGLIFVPPRLRTAMMIVLAAGLVTFGASSAVVAQQRSGVMAYGATIVVAALLYVLAQRRRQRLIWLSLMVLFGLASLGIAYYAREVATEAQERFSDVEAYEGAKSLRLGGLFTFFSDVLENPLNPVPIGHQSLLDRTGVEPHLLVSEAYYEGGPIFLVVILVILYKFGAACIALARSADPHARIVGNILCAFGAGAAIQVTIQTALGLRLVPLVLGVGIAARRVMRAQGRST